jgi:hypothetical protein
VKQRRGVIILMVFKCFVPNDGRSPIRKDGEPQDQNPVVSARDCPRPRTW